MKLLIRLIKVKKKVRIFHTSYVMIRLIITMENEILEKKR